MWEHRPQEDKHSGQICTVAARMIIPSQCVYGTLKPRRSHHMKPLSHTEHYGDCGIREPTRLLSRPVVLLCRLPLPLRGHQQCLEIFLIRTRGKGYQHLVVRGQECCQTSQDSLPQPRLSGTPNVTRTQLKTLVLADERSVSSMSLHFLTGRRK